MPKSKQKRRARSADKIHNDWQSQPDDKRRRKIRRESSDAESLPSNLIGNNVDKNHLDEIIDSVISQTCGNDQPEGESVDPAKTEELKKEVAELKKTIQFLQTRVDFLLSYLGIADNKGSDAKSTAVSLNPSDWPKLSKANDQVIQSSNQQNNVLSGPSAQRVAMSNSKTHSQFRQDLVSAVYVDLHEKQKRSNNVVITGLPAASQTDDASVVVGMFVQEFGRQPTIKASRRLGVPSTTRNRPLLVTLSSADEASYYLTNAKRLRHSTNEYVRANIFVNADLTPAEAKAAYEMRCRRREAQKSKTVLEFRRSKSSSQSQSADVLSLGGSSADIGSQSTSLSNTVTAINGIQSVSTAEFITDNNALTRTPTSSKGEASMESASSGVDSKNDSTETIQTIPVIDTRLICNSVQSAQNVNVNT